jgi:hypothetical protein
MVGEVPSNGKLGAVIVGAVTVSLTALILVYKASRR